MRRIDEKKLKDLKKGGKTPRNEKGKPVGTDAAIPGVRRHKAKRKVSVLTPEELRAQEEKKKGAEAVKSLAQSLESAVKSSQEIVKVTHKMVDGVLVRLEQISIKPVDVKVDVKTPEPVKNKQKTIRCENIERDDKGYIKSFELKEM